MHMTRGQAMWALGHHEAAIAVYTEGARSADTGGWRQAAAYLRHNIGWVLAEQGRLAEAEQSFHLAVELSDDELGHTRAVTLNGLGYVCFDQGRLAEAAEYFGAALRINQKTGREKSLLANRSNLGMVLRQLGQESAAEEHLRAALEGHRRTSNRNGELAALEELSLLHMQRGHSTAAMSTAERGYDLAVIARDRRAQAALLVALGEAQLGAGDVPSAQESFERVFALVDEFPFLATRAAIGTANVLLALGDNADARRHAERALAEARGRGYGVLEADALSAQARCVASEDPAAAARLAAMAVTLYRAAGAEPMAAKVEAERARLGDV
jgi:tetratricopeptide (TPR) repeat protein